MITQKRLKEVLSYNPPTGVFRWKISRSGVKKGDVAGGQMQTGYRLIGIDGERYLAHRLVWIYVYGHFPFEIDHIDGDKMNNSFSNLRDVTRVENSRNRRIKKGNKSGSTGVSWDKVNRKWRATIKVDYKQKNIGRFLSIEEAMLARKAAEAEYGFHINHGMR
jgi:hypothetical protein